MSKISIVLIAIVMAVTLHPALALGQSPDSRTIDEIHLKIEDGESWFLMRDEAGNPSMVESLQMLDGVPQVELNPSTAELYETHQVQDVYWSQVNVNINSDWYLPRATSVNTRITRLADASFAEQYLGSLYETQLTAVAKGEIADLLFAPIDPVPEFDRPIVGWTLLRDYIDDVSGESIGFGSSVRYNAQIDNYVISVEITGPFVDYNFDAAWWLLRDQAFCVMSDLPCESVDMPMGETDYLFIGNVLYFSNYAGGGEGFEARWLFPVDTPVRAPQASASFAPDINEDSAEPAGVGTANAEPADSTSTSSTATVIAAGANVREEPSASAAIADALSTGDSVTITGDTVTTDGYVWVPVVTHNGVEGWIAEQLIQRD